MDSLKKLFRIGVGPSSSHTMAPKRAAQIFLKRNPFASHFKIFLFDSLAATGKGHLTDKAIEEIFSPRSFEIIWRAYEELALHPNGMRFVALNKNRKVIDSWVVFSVGGGALLTEKKLSFKQSFYPLSNMQNIIDHCIISGEPLWKYVEHIEGKEIWGFLEAVWEHMKCSLKKGLTTEGFLPGSLGLTRKAPLLFARTMKMKMNFHYNGLLAAYAYAVSEVNAAGGTIVTAPTCGACAVLPSVLYYLDQTIKPSQSSVLKAIATAGLIGNIVKEKASISGAEVGCQGEIGTACAMAAGAATQLLGGTINQIEYAAEMGLEHHLGLTCDPVEGLVQIPCIERNAHAATRALSCCHFALLSDGEHKISFDDVVTVMKETGQALPSLYRETSVGGLAKAYRLKKTTFAEK